MLLHLANTLFVMLFLANTLCVAPMFGGWFRAQVVESTDDSEQCLVRFVDYGGYCSIDKSSLRQIRSVVPSE